MKSPAQPCSWRRRLRRSSPARSWSWTAAGPYDVFGRWRPRAEPTARCTMDVGGVWKEEPRMNDHGTGFMLTRRAALSPERTALIFRDESWTYAELNRVTNRVAHGLHSLGVNPGDRVGFLGLNHPRFLFTLFGAAKLGAIFVPLNFRLTGPGLAFIIRDSGLHTLVYEENFASIIDAIRKDLPVRRLICSTALDGSRSFDDLIHDQRDTDLDFPVPEDSVAWIMYTSGTTGQPKGAMLSHGNILWNNINASLAFDGLTETAPFASFLPSDKAEAKVGSAGIAPFFSEVRVVDENDHEVPDGQRGEIVVRGPNVMKGYWGRPDATAEILVDGWFHTGDIGKRDADGYFYILDRKKDMIISGGENVYPAEVEDVLYQHPHVKEVAVIGVQHSRWGETVRAVVVVKEGASLTEQDVIAFAEGKLARFKQPKSVMCTDTLPRNPTGKVIKFELREKFGQPMTETEEAQPADQRAARGAGTPS